jgi:class 3 adenylate cyclase/tetratricopeptide (TPR) repeat protein
MAQRDDADDGTVACPHCGSLVPAAFRFCGVCGRPLSATCWNCGASLAPAFRYCGACGTPVDPSAGATGDPTAGGLTEERRVVSVLVADLEGSTRLATTLDAEELHRTMRPLIDALAEEVAVHGGTLQRYAGDGVVAVFGAPVARGDDPVRAVRAAQAMQERLVRVNATVGGREPLAMRVGVATGDVVTVVDDPDLARATGDAFNLASRLQTIAPVGHVVVDRRTWRDTRHAISYRPTDGPHDLRGFPEPVAAWVAEDEPAAASRYRMPLVGRTAELARLAAVMQEAVDAAAPRSVTVVGDPGVGKSRLAHELVTSVVPRMWPDARVVTGHCLPYGRGLALWPLAEILRSDLDARLGEPAEQIANRAYRTLTARWPASDDADLVHALLASVGLTAPAGRRDVTTSHSATRSIVTRLMGRAWRSYLEVLAVGGPLVVRIEDLQWGDEDLIAVLDAVLATARFPLCVVATARRDTGRRAMLTGEVVDLAPLDDTDAGVLLSRLLGAVATDEVVLALGERVDGNPFFAEQLVEMLRDEGALAARSSADPLVRLPDRLPDNVQAAIGARLDLLPPSELAVALHAAVVGRSWWPGAVAHLLGRAVDDDVDRLVDRGMGIVQPDSDIQGESRVLFAHALLRDVAYERVPRRLRRRLHRDIGRWIEGRASGREEEFAEILAHHFELAGEHGATARYALLAGERKLSLFAGDEAIAWFARAQNAADRADLDAGEHLLCRIALRTGAAHEQLGEFAAAEEDFRRALRAAEEARSDGRRAEALAATAHVLWLRDAYDRAEPLLAEALAIAEALGRTELISQIKYTTGALGFGRGRYALAAQAQRDALAAARAVGDREAEASALHGLSEALAFTGPLTSALAQCVSCSDLVRRLGWLPMLHHNESMRGWILMWMGRLPEAAETFARAGEGADELGDPRNAAHAYAGVGHVRWLLGGMQEAWKSLHRAEELERRFRAPRTLLMIKSHELHLLADAGRWADVREELDACWEASDAIGGRFLRAQLYAWEGWLALRDGDHARAVRCFGEAADCAGDARTERWFALQVEAIAWAEARADARADRLIAVGDALRDVGRDSVSARALGDYAFVAAAVERDVPDIEDVIERREQIASDLPPVYRRRWWLDLAQVHRRSGRADDAAAAETRASAS